MDGLAEAEKEFEKIFHQLLGRPKSASHKVAKYPHQQCSKIQGIGASNHFTANVSSRSKLVGPTNLLSEFVPSSSLSSQPSQPNGQVISFPKSLPKPGIGCLNGFVSYDQSHLTMVPCESNFPCQLRVPPRHDQFPTIPDESTIKAEFKSGSRSPKQRNMSNQGIMSNLLANQSNMSSLLTNHGSMSSQLTNQINIYGQSTNQGNISRQSTNQSNMFCQSTNQSNMFSQSANQGNISSQSTNQGNISSQSTNQRSMSSQSADQSNVARHTVNQKSKLLSKSTNQSNRSGQSTNENKLLNISTNQSISENKYLSQTKNQGKLSDRSENRSNIQSQLSSQSPNLPSLLHEPFCDCKMWNWSGCICNMFNDAMQDCINITDGIQIDGLVFDNEVSLNCVCHCTRQRKSTSFELCKHLEDCNNCTICDYRSKGNSDEVKTYTAFNQLGANGNDEPRTHIIPLEGSEPAVYCTQENSNECLPDEDTMADAGAMCSASHDDTNSGKPPNIENQMANSKNQADLEKKSSLQHNEANHKQQSPDFETPRCDAAAIILHHERHLKTPVENIESFPTDGESSTPDKMHLPNATEQANVLPLECKELPPLQAEILNSTKDYEEDAESGYYTGDSLMTMASSIVSNLSCHQSPPTSSHTFSSERSHMSPLPEDATALTVSHEPETPERQQLRRAINSFNENTQGLIMTLGSDLMYQGFIRIFMNLMKPISMSLSNLQHLIPSSGEDEETLTTSFYLPKDTAKVIHISNHTSTAEVIKAILFKFKITDNPRKFALYVKGEDGELRRLHDEDEPLQLVLDWGAHNIDSYRLVLQESDSGEILWDAFSIPELANFLKILDREENEYIEQIRTKYHLLSLQIRQLLADCISVNQQEVAICDEERSNKIKDNSETDQPTSDVDIDNLHVAENDVNF